MTVVFLCMEVQAGWGWQHLSMQTATYLFCYVKRVAVRLRVKPTAAECLSQNRVIWLFYSLKNQVIKTCYK